MQNGQTIHFIQRIKSDPCWQRCYYKKQGCFASILWFYCTFIDIDIKGKLYKKPTNDAGHRS
jgi:hypothetical protein